MKFPSVSKLLGRGYLPRELPPPFRSETWAQCATENRKHLPLTPKPPFIAHICTHSIPRTQGGRRTLGIPNPLSQLLLSETLFDGAKELLTLIHDDPRPYLSASRPMHWESEARALVPRYKLTERLKLRMKTRRAARCLVRTDISQFYGSIYTHSIPWALHTKSVAKARRSDASLLGNRLDRALRNGQDGQTVGIPIGPDTSLLVAEVLLRAIDNEIRESVGAEGGFRYVDDYELSFQSRWEAERGLARMESILQRFELKLNPRKTFVEDLPAHLDEGWVDRIREVCAEHDDINVRTIRRLAAVSFDLAKQFPADSVLKFAIASIGSRRPRDGTAAQYMQSFAFNAMTSSPLAVPAAMALLVRLEKADFWVNRPALTAVLNAQISRAVEVLHPSEVAWAVWGALAFDLRDMRIPRELAQMEDDVVALLTLHGRARGLWDLEVPVWESWMTKEELRGPHWLTAYEARIKGWLPSSTGDHIAEDPVFTFLRDKEVHFYEEEYAGMNEPSAAAPIPGGMFGDFYA